MILGQWVNTVLVDRRRDGYDRPLANPLDAWWKTEDAIYVKDKEVLYHIFHNMKIVRITFLSAVFLVSYIQLLHCFIVGYLTDKHQFSLIHVFFTTDAHRRPWPIQPVHLYYFWTKTMFILSHLRSLRTLFLYWLLGHSLGLCKHCNKF